MAQLAEVYIHLRPFYVSAERLNELGKATDKITRDAATRIYNHPVSISVELIEGTLWGKIKVTGAVLLSVYTVASGYKGLIDSAELACSQAKSFGHDVCGAFIKESGANPQQVVRLEKRLKTPGKLRRALRRIERLDNMATSLSKAQLEEQLKIARLELEAAIKDLDQEELNALKSGLQFDNLPPFNHWPTQRPKAEMPRVAIRVQGAQLQFGKDLMIGNESGKFPEKRRRHHYHNEFLVSPREDAARGKAPFELRSDD